MHWLLLLLHVDVVAPKGAGFVIPAECNVEHSTYKIFPCGVQCRVEALKRAVFRIQMLDPHAQLRLGALSSDARCSAGTFLA